MESKTNGDVDRRTVLKSLTAAGATMAGVSGHATAAENSVHTVEAGIYYDFEEDPGVGTTHLGSRPRFTIDQRRNNLVFGNDVSQARVNAASEKGALINESPTAKGGLSETHDSGRTVRTIPIELSARMRAKSGVKLAASQTLPDVSVKWQGSAAKLVVPGKGRFELEAGTEREVRLPAETVTVETSEIVEKAVPIEGRPEHRWGPKREYGSKNTKATPVVRAVDHGQLGVRRKEMP